MFGFLAQLLAWCFDVVPNYAIAIALMTLIVMAAVTPFTIKGMRSAAQMSRLQPEMKKLQEQYKNDRVKQNEEVQALFKEHGVNPLGGCLPMLLPLPIFFIIFRLLRGLNARHNGVFAPLVRVLRHNIGGPGGYVAPHYLSYKTT
ncbi:MAG TPA: membrane protein insertase YidC, partial [Acidimicrobiales bacterium]|nr:membrane protein insertase YidC [Acidimicrobiales bacterium]